MSYGKLFKHLFLRTSFYFYDMKIDMITSNSVMISIFLSNLQLTIFLDTSTYWI